ncbi:MAG TPA: hypothetical protein VKV02_04870, partial [Acidobacteriaceae bacterium]|nr:hypothetical protein [Acidobacteriaceae bacterium]
STAGWHPLSHGRKPSNPRVEVHVLKPLALRTAFQSLWPARFASAGVPLAGLKRRGQSPSRTYCGELLGGRTAGGAGSGWRKRARGRDHLGSGKRGRSIVRGGFPLRDQRPPGDS